VWLQRKWRKKSDFTHYLGQDSDASEIRESNDFAIVVGYGKVGKLVCELLDNKLYKYVGLETNPNRAIEARNKGLPVFYGDIGRPEVAEAFNVGKANSIILTISDKAEINRAVISLRRKYPDKKIFARAVDADHAERLQRTLDVIAMVPVVPEDSILLTLPFGGAVLRSLGAAQEEVNAILESTRKDILSGRGSRSGEEQQMVLAQLGIQVKTTGDETTKKDKKAKKDKKDGDEKSSVDTVPEKTTMVAEVIEAMVADVKSEEDDDQDTDDGDEEEEEEDSQDEKTGQDE